MTITDTYIEILINTRGSSLLISDKGLKLYCDKLGCDLASFRYDLIKRDDTTLIECFKELGDEFNYGNAIINIVKIPKKFFKYYRLNIDRGYERVYYDYETYHRDHSNSDDNSIKVLVNSCYGGFGISDIALSLYLKKKIEIDPNYKVYECSLSRTDPILVECFEELGNEFNKEYAQIRIEEIPAKYKDYLEIIEYDGSESIEIDIIQYEYDIENYSLY